MKPHGDGLVLGVVSGILAGLSAIAVILRSFVRLRIVKAFGWDDGLMVIAVVLKICCATIGIVGIYHGIGQKFAALSPNERESALVFFWLSELLYLLTSTVARIAIPLSILRIIAKQRSAIIMWLILGLNSNVGMAANFVLTLQCHPVSFFWRRSGDGSCLKPPVILGFLYFTSIIACTCDLTLGIFPFFFVRQLQMDRQTKIALACTLGMGCLASIAVLIRIPYIHYYYSPDFLSATKNIVIWSTMEADLVIIGGSFITIRPFYRWFRDGPSSDSPSFSMKSPLRGSSNKHTDIDTYVVEILASSAVLPRKTMKLP